MIGGVWLVVMVIYFEWFAKREVTESVRMSDISPEPGGVDGGGVDSGDKEKDAEGSHHQNVELYGVE